MTTRRYCAILFMATALACSACADGEGGVGVSNPTTTEPATVSAAPTEAPTSTTPPAAAAESSDEPIVYVVMGNSLLFSTPAVMYAYRDILQEDLGVEVDMRDHTVGGQATHHFLTQLRTNDRLRSDLAQADVVLLVVPNDEWKEPGYTIMGMDGRDPTICGGDDGLLCLRVAAANYNAMADEIFAELTALADPSETVIRVMDFQLFTPGEDDEAAVATLAPLWQESQEYVETVASRYGIPVAQVFDELMSPNGIGIPEEKGLVSSDGVHYTEVGTQLIAQMIRELGYEPVGVASNETVVISGMLDAPAEYINGEQWGEPIPGTGFAHARGTVIRSPITTLSDDRVNGDFAAVMDLDFFAGDDRMTGLIGMTSVTITNSRGTWEGTAAGTTTWTTADPEHMHNIHYTLLGTGDYEGLQFSFHTRGVDYPWTVTGTITAVEH